MNGNEIKPLENKLDVIINLLAARCVAGKERAEGVVFLDRFGLDRKVAAAIYDTSPDTIRACISKAKKSNNKTRSSKKK